MTDTIGDLVRQASEALPEPFSRAALLNWVRRARPDVEESSVGTHIQYATANADNASNPFRGGARCWSESGAGSTAATAARSGCRPFRRRRRQGCRPFRRRSPLLLVRVGGGRRPRRLLELQGVDGKYRRKAVHRRRLDQGPRARPAGDRPLSLWPISHGNTGQRGRTPG
ncbi:DUF7669 domain-containing protein [Trujillonella humicola]|uniref:DUF7669 domain-containing protein n=1 Tax=Trujillonella humicola TaxID=3383699 RepID=UPI003CC81714